MSFVAVGRTITASFLFVSSLYATTKNLVDVPVNQTNEMSLAEESLQDILDMKSEVKVNVGSRDGARNYLDANTPVDVITSDQISHSGLTTLVDVLRYFVAGFNSPVVSVADGSDHVAAYTLRSMNSDQILVLINGKRLHTSSLLHVNGTIGRGSSHADLNTIALNSIDKIEILRDGAAAQYGSDAISGVINVILKGMGHENSVSVHTGVRKEGDGLQRQVDTFVSIPLKYDGFVNVALEINDQEQTQRAGADSRLNPPAVRTHAGIANSRNYKALLYAEAPQNNGINIYTNLLLNERESEASTFFRPASSSTSGLYLNGFLPILQAKITDYSLVLGVKGEMENNIKWDLSTVYGHNEIQYNLKDTMNYSLGATSPLAFNNGDLAFSQHTTTLDFKKIGDNFSLAGGFEFRKEKYEINAGDFGSGFGTGSEGFSGYRLENEADETRSNYSIYLNTKYNFTQDFTLEASLRYENYSDYGESVNEKIALSYKPVSSLMLRSSASTGFRAPSLAQKHYSQTSSFVSDTNVLTTQGTFKTNHEIAKVLGIDDLKSENSLHLTVGAVYQPNQDSSFMVDLFYISVDDRILLTPELTATTQAEQNVFAKYGVSAARFLENAANIRTKGLDIKYNYKYKFSSISDINFNIWFNHAQNEPTKGNNAHGQSKTIKTMIVSGQPRNSLKFLTNYKYKDLCTTVNLSRFGEYAQYQDGREFRFDASWTVDLDLSYKINKATAISIGGSNIFDMYPKKWDNLSGVFYGTNGIKQYSRYSPYGYSGAYYYLRASMKF